MLSWLFQDEKYTKNRFTFPILFVTLEKLAWKNALLKGTINKFIFSIKLGKVVINLKGWNDFGPTHWLLELCT